MTYSALHTFDALRRAMPETISSDRLVMRELEMKDADPLQRLANNKAIFEVLARLPHPYERAHAHDFIQNLSRTPTEHAYAVTRDDAFVGVIGFHFDAFQGNDVLELGYWLGEPYWGKGYATEAAKALVSATLALDSKAPVFARSIAVNTMSCNVLKKVGFVPSFQANDVCGQHNGQLMQFFDWGGERHERT